MGLHGIVIFKAEMCESYLGMPKLILLDAFCIGIVCIML